MEKNKRIYLGAHIPEGSRLHDALLKEQADTGQSVAAIIRDALTRRYGIKVKGNGKEGK